MSLGFHDVIFPEEISYGSSGGPEFNTTVISLNSGYEKRNINWSQVRAKYNAAHGIKEREQMEELLAFFYARMGKAYSFRYFDPLDFNTGHQVLGAGDGTRTDFQIVKVYVSGVYTYTRKITKPIDGSLVGVRVGGVIQNPSNYTINWSSGVISFKHDFIPASLAVVEIENCEFHVHARFDTDHMEVTHDFWETMSWPQIPIVEIKDKG